MASQEKKATGETTVCPEETLDAQPDDDLECSASETPKKVRDSEETASESQDEQELREGIKKIFKDLEGKITQSLLAKRKQIRKDIRASFQAVNEQLNHVIKAKQKERESLHSQYSEVLLQLFEQWQRDAVKAEEEEEDFLNMSRQQERLLLQLKKDAEEKYEEIKKFAAQFMQSVKILQENHRTVEQAQVGKEMANLKKKVIVEYQRQDVETLETFLQSLLPED